MSKGVTSHSHRETYRQLSAHTLLVRVEISRMRSLFRKLRLFRCTKRRTRSELAVPLTRSRDGLTDGAASCFSSYTQRSGGKYFHFHSPLRSTTLLNTPVRRCHAERQHTFPGHTLGNLYRFTHQYCVICWCRCGPTSTCISHVCFTCVLRFVHVAVQSPDCIVIKLGRASPALQFLHDVETLYELLSHGLAS